MTKRKTTRKVTKKQVKKEPAKAKPIVLYINRFVTYCGECSGNILDRGVKTCPDCGVLFTHVDTTCPLVWMKSIIKVHRPDLLVMGEMQVVGPLPE